MSYRQAWWCILLQELDSSNKDRDKQGLENEHGRTQARIRLNRDRSIKSVGARGKHLDQNILFIEKIEVLGVDPERFAEDQIQVQSKYAFILDSHEQDGLDHNKNLVFI